MTPTPSTATPPDPPTPTSLTLEQQARLAERYGAARRTPRGLLVAVALVVAAFLGWVLWAGLQQADKEVRWRTVGYGDFTERSVTVRFDVFKDPGTPVTCLVRAMDVRGNEVGRADVPVDPAVGDTLVVYALPVTSQAATVDVTRCVVDE